MQKITLPNPLLLLCDPSGASGGRDLQGLALTLCMDMSGYSLNERMS